MEAGTGRNVESVKVARFKPVMPDVLTALTHLIQSPPGQLAAGGILTGIVWKFFERVQAVLTDQTKLEIAVWLLGVKFAQDPALE
jgi:hypothetical protein